MTTTADDSTTALRSLRIPVVTLGLSLSSFIVISYVLCILWGLLIPLGGAHARWLEFFFPGFKWLTLPGFLIGLAESVTYGWYTAVLFGSLFNLFAARRA